MDYLQKKDIPTVEMLYSIFHEEVHKRIYFLLSNYNNSLIDSDDLAQETWVKVTNSYNKVPDDWNVRSWVLRVAVNVVIDFMRKKKRSCEEVTLIEEYDNEIEESPESGFIHREQITSTYASMREADRFIVQLYAHGYSYDEILQEAQKQQIKATRTGIKMYVSRSKRKFREAYEQFTQ